MAKSAARKLKDQAAQAPVRGKFITFEGGEGAGKSTQLRLLADRLAERGVVPCVTREPGGAPGAETLRSLLLSGQHDWAPAAEMLLHTAARAEHIEKTIRPALAAGHWVLCDRFADSTMAYQGFGQGADRAAIASLTAMLGLTPDLTLILDVSEATAAAREAARGRAADRYDRLGPDFHRRVADGFRHIAATNPARCVLIDANGDIAAVAATILAVVEQRLRPGAPPLDPAGGRASRPPSIK
jgi:dTMP kinase